MVGIKRFMLACLLTSVPLVWAEPISIWQEPVLRAPEPPGISTPAARPVRKKIQIRKNRAPISRGTASWYSEKDPGINRHTANGEVFDDTKMTCASWHFPFGTLLEVKNTSNGKSVVCRVNDRGPARRLNRVIDLTKAAFRKIADPRRGLVKVTVQPVTPSR